MSATTAGLTGPAAELPAELVAELNGTDLERKIGPAYLVVTDDPDGRPRPCLLSLGELLCVEPTSFRVAVWPGTGTAANVQRHSRVLLCHIAAGAAIHVLGQARRSWSSAGVLAAEIEVRSVSRDLHAGFEITSGIRYDHPGQALDAVLAEWRRKLDVLRRPP